ncbi:MAG TPA: patatin-like phospholipase family protein [Solirubrobacteraceae bacterium]|nr:patatin-like phospholipase family protein [Solirubrobacteraceae bacterium]
MARPFLFPDVLVLAGGGVLGEAWMNGVLAGVEEAAGVDFRRVESLVGTSAGSIVASRLAAGHRPRHPGSPTAAEAPGERAGEDGGAGDGPLARALREVVGWAFAATAPLAPAAVAAGAPAGALARSLVLARVPAGHRRLDDLHRVITRRGVHFDGRLRVCCVDRRSGRRVVFGAPGAPRATVADAVVASCAIPGVFAPVAIGGREYVDGGAWSVTNLDAAPAREGSEVLLLEPTALPVGWRTGAGALRLALGAATTLELQVLRARGAHVRRVAPDAPSARLMSGGLMRQGPAQRVLAAGHAQGLALARARQRSGGAYT